LSVLIAALIIGLAIWVPVAASGTLRWLVVSGLIGAVGLRIWLLISILRVGR